MVFYVLENGGRDMTKRLLKTYPASIFYGVVGIVYGILYVSRNPNGINLTIYIISIFGMTLYGIYVDWTHRND